MKTDTFPLYQTSSENETLKKKKIIADHFLKMPHFYAQPNGWKKLVLRKVTQQIMPANLNSRFSGSLSHFHISSAKYRNKVCNKLGYFLSCFLPEPLHILWHSLFNFGAEHCGNISSEMCVAYHTLLRLVPARI